MGNDCFWLLSTIIKTTTIMKITTIIKIANHLQSKLMTFSQNEVGILPLEIKNKSFCKKGSNYKNLRMPTLGGDRVFIVEIERRIALIK